jgi:hypothetical protein
MEFLYAVLFLYCRGVLKFISYGVKLRDNFEALCAGKHKVGDSLYVLHLGDKISDVKQDFVFVFV